MGTSDGYVVGSHKIVDHGPNSQRFNLVILGDGYQASELEKFATDTTTFINTLRATDPYPDLWCGFNVFRIDVVSTDSGADDPGTCGDGTSGSGATPKTYFDATFCSDGNVRRLLSCNDDTALSVSNSFVPETHLTMVIVNTDEYGGSSDGRVAKLSTNSQSAEIAIHEMGHLAFSFADEYDCRTCVATETGQDHFSGSDPLNKNVTTNTDRTTIKWKSQLTSATDTLPTTSNPDCTKRDSQSNPQAADYVGAYEGADYFHCGCYRPSFNCRMRQLGVPFCAVCQAVIRAALQPFLPAESLTLTTPSIAFTNVPEGLGGVGVTTYRAIVFDVVTCATRTFVMTSGPTGGFGTPLGTSAVASANDDSDPVDEVRLWVSYTSTSAGSTSNGSVTVTCTETGQSWVINITANTVARPKSAVALVLDHSGSMADDAGDGNSKVGKLREACNIFINSMLDNDGLAVVRFDDTAQTLMGVTNVGPPILGAGRNTAIGLISGPQLDPAGNTSIGAGVVAGKAALDAAASLYPVRSMLVLTDGEENTPPMLADVGGSITANTFAIGLGQPENISTAALNTLTQNHSGYLLVTGTLTSDQAARLNKYFVQVLAGVSNANVVLDPHGVLTGNAVHRIPFQIAETEYGLDVFLLTETPWALNFRLQTPDGTLLDPGSTATLTNIQYVQTGAVAYYRLSLPGIAADPAGSHGGTWHAVLNLGRRATGDQTSFVAGTVAARSVSYDLVVHCYSNLVFNASLVQSSFEPGATVSVHAAALEYAVPVERRAFCWASVTRPDSTAFELAMPESEAGRFAGQFTAAVPGLYIVRVRCIGSTFQGTGFQREQTLTASVYYGGNSSSGGGSNNGGSEFWCTLLKCVLRDGVLDRALLDRLEKSGVNVGALLKCLEGSCGGNQKPPR